MYKWGELTRKYILYLLNNLLAKNNLDEMMLFLPMKIVSTYLLEFDKWKIRT